GRLAGRSGWARRPGGADDAFPVIPLGSGHRGAAQLLHLLGEQGPVPVGTLQSAVGHRQVLREDEESRDGGSQRPGCQADRQSCCEVPALAAYSRLQATAGLRGFHGFPPEARNRINGMQRPRKGMITLATSQRRVWVTRLAS